MSRKEDIHMFPPDISTKVKKKKKAAETNKNNKTKL